VPDLPLVDLPAPKHSAKGTLHGGFADLPAPTGDLDRPGARAASGPLLDLESPVRGIVDLPTPKGIVDLPTPKGIVDLPTPKGIVDLPTPKGIVDLPTPRGITDLPTPKGLVDLPGPKGDQGFGELDLPMPKLAAVGEDEASFGDLELPDLPVRAGFGDIELPIPRPGADVHKPKAPTYQGVGPRGSGDESNFGDLDLGGSAGDRNDEMSFDDIRPDDLLALKSDLSGLDSPNLPHALRGEDDGELPEGDYGEAGLLDDGEDDMEFGIAGESEDGFALPPEILRRQRGEAAQAADVARGKRALHVLIGVAIVLAVVGAVGAGLGFTDYGYFGVYFLERYLPEAGEPRFTREVIARAEKTAASDTYRDARRALALLGEARHKTGLNRELLTRSLLHDALFLVRFGADPNSSARVAAILSRLEERHGLAPGMNLARAADAARRQAYADAEKFLNSARSEAPRDPYVGLLAGEVALRQGKLAEAEKAFAEALKLAGGARAQWGLARVALARTDEAARSSAVEETLKLSPLHAEARLADARILWAQGKEERAMHELRQALGQEPIDDQYLWTSKPAKAEGYSLLGYASEARGRLQPARKAYEDALSADPYLVEALLGAGRVLLRERRFSDALARFESGLAMAQKAGSATVLSGRRADAEARLGQGRALLALNRAPDAKASLSILMKDNPNDAEIVLALGQVEDALGNKTAAEELLKKGVELAPSTFASYLALSQHYFKLNQPDKASETLNEAAGRVEENVEMRRMLGQSELARNRFDSALHEFKRAVELDPQDFDARFGLGIAYRKTGELEKARVLFDEIATRDAQYAGLALERGQLLEAQGEYAKAVEAYRAAHQKDPSDSALTLRLGAAQVEADQLDDAAQTLQIVMHETPNSAEAEYFMGRLALARGRGPDALTHFDRALSLDGAQAPYHLFAARAALEMGNLGRTLDEAEAALSRDPTLGDGYWIRGIVRMRSGAVKDALKDAKRALELAPGRYDAYALMAECHDELRQLPQAAESYLTALGKDPGRGEWWYKLGRLYLDMGSRPQGSDALNKAMALGDKRDLMPYWLPDAYRLAGEIARGSNNRRLAVTLFKRYLKIAPDGALDRDDVRKVLRSWDVDLSEE
jgi:tetratricopeptide (TPR) repeat protein